MDLNSISAISESFRVVFRMYVFFEIEDLAEFHLDHLAAKARAAKERYSLSRSEVEEFSARYNIPKVAIFNLVEGGPEGDVDIRIYGGFKSRTMIMWNQVYRVVCRERFELHAFPFDSNELNLDLRLNDPLTWDIFELRVNIVQFHKTALIQTEYDIYNPLLKAGSPAHKCSSVIFLAKRRPQYYLQNIVLMMFALSMLGLLAFVMEVDALGDRVSVVLTLILTAVAFKFVIDYLIVFFSKVI